jgi:hypothetical protein
MNLCLDLVTWTVAMAIGLVASLWSLHYAISDRAALHKHLAARAADESKRQLGVGMLTRMRRNATHAVFSEAMRAMAVALFLFVGAGAVFGPSRQCSFSLSVTFLIVGGVLIVFNTLHALYTRQGNDFSEGPTDDADAARDAERDAARDPARDDARDAEQKS